MAFRQLRKVFNIDAGDYMLSVCGMLPGLCQASHAQNLPSSTAPAGLIMQSSSCKSIYRGIAPVSEIRNSGVVILQGTRHYVSCHPQASLAASSSCLMMTASSSRPCARSGWCSIRAMSCTCLSLIRTCCMDVINCKHTLRRPISRQWNFTAYALYLSQLMHCTFCTFKLHAAVTTQR